MKSRRAGVCDARTLAALIGAIIMTPSLPARADTNGIMALGVNPGNAGQVHAVSADGSVVVGYTTQSGRRIPFRWSQSSGAMTLGYLHAPNNPNSEAKGVSDNGVYTVGTESLTVGFGNPTSVGFRWTPPGSTQGFGSPIAWRYTGINAVSDNNVAVGYVPSHLSPSERIEATTWTGNQQLLLGFMEPVNPNASSEAKSVTPDGSVVVGWGSSTTGQRAFRWTQQTGMVPMELLPGHNANDATDISADGSVIVGTTSTSGRRNIFRWTETTGMVDLGRLPNTFVCDNLRASGDGSIIVGNCDGRPLIWTETLGLRLLRPTLETYYGIDMSGWVIWTIGDVSSDGNYLVGFGNNNGVPDAFRIRIPEPGVLSMLILVSPLAIRFRRSRSGR